MTQPLSATSPRRVVAARFAAELRKAMTARGASTKRLAPAVGCAPSAISMWRIGSNLPRLDTTARLADALDWPKLVAIVREGRVGSCARCGREFANEGGSPKRFCSSECREVDAMMRQRQPVSILASAVRAEVDRVHGTSGSVSRKALTAALDEYGRSEAKRVTRNRSVERRALTIQAAVDAMCAGCEPSGVCRTSECALRSVSPLPLALDPDKRTAEVRPAEGPWGPTFVAAQLASIREANAERWSRPGERERASAVMVARYAAETPDEKVERARRISEAKRRSA